MKRAARLALELVAPKVGLAPLKAIALPCNLVRQGLEKVRDFGLKIGHHAGLHLSRDFMLLTQIPAAVLRPIRAAIQAITRSEPTLELRLGPKRGSGLER